MQPTLLLLTVCVLALAMCERRKRWTADSRRHKADRLRRQAERGFREQTESLRAIDANLYGLDCRYQVLGEWTLEEGRSIDEIAVEQNQISGSRLLIDQWIREPDAVAVGSRLEQRWRRNGTGDD